MDQNLGKLLFDESPLIIQKKLAMKLGVDEALFIQQLHYLIKNKETGSDFYTLRDGNWWVYNTWWGWQEFFPFWDQKKLQRLIGKLEKMKVLITTDKYNSMPADKTKWYRIEYDVLMKMPERNYFEKEGNKEKEKKKERILASIGQSVLMSNNKGSETPKKEKEPLNHCGTPLGQNVLIQKDKVSQAIPKNSLPKISSLKDSVIMYVSVDMPPLKFFTEIIISNPTKYVQIELLGLEKEYGKDLVNESIKRLADKNTTKYIATLKGILRNWTNAGAETLNDVKRIEDEHKQQYKKNKQKENKNKKRTRKIVREEMIPDWVTNPETDQPPSEKELDEAIEERRRRIEEIKNKFKR